MTYKGRNIEIRYKVFPEEVQGYCSGFVSAKFKSKYIVVIDSTRTPLHQRKALGHELAHIFLDHLYQKDRPIPEIEAEAERNAWKYYRLYKAGALDNT